MKLHTINLRETRGLSSLFYATSQIIGISPLLLPSGKKNILPFLNLRFNEKLCDLVSVLSFRFVCCENTKYKASRLFSAESDKSVRGSDRIPNRCKETFLFLRRGLLPQFQDLRTRGSESALAEWLLRACRIARPTSNLPARKSHRLRERSGHEFVGSTRDHRLKPRPRCFCSSSSCCCKHHLLHRFYVVYQY